MESFSQTHSVGKTSIPDFEEQNRCASQLCSIDPSCFGRRLQEIRILRQIIRTGTFVRIPPVDTMYLPGVFFIFLFLLYPDERKAS